MSGSGAIGVMNGAGLGTGSLVARDASDVSGVCFLGCTAGLFFSVRAIFVLISAKWLNIGTESGVLAGFGVSLVLLLAASMQGFGGLAKPMGPMWKVSGVRWVAAYLAFSCCSLLWTASVSPLASFLYWCSLAVDVTTVMILFRGYEARTAAHSMMKGFIWGSCLMGAIAWMMPAAEDLRLGDLDYFNTNQIGNLCALSIFLCSLLASREDGRWRLTALFLIVTLLRSLSKATIVAFVAAQGYLLLRGTRMSGTKKLLLVFAVAAGLAAFWGLLDAYYGLYTTTGNQAETLTGRTAIWAWTLNAALSSPWIGNGVDAMWKIAPPFGGELFEARHAENELLQQFFAYGAAGIVMMVGVYGSLWRGFRRVTDQSTRTTLTAILVFIWIRGLAEAEPFDLLLPLWMCMVLAFFASSATVMKRWPGDGGSEGKQVLASAGPGLARRSA